MAKNFYEDSKSGKTIVHPPNEHLNREWMIRGQESRILLTDRCNYRCLFCHGEGVELSKGPIKDKDESSTLKVVEKILDKGCTDITLTGGEPLLRKELVLQILEFASNANPLSKVTVTTNASLLDSSWIEKAAKTGNIRLNVSLHSADSDIYMRLTGQKVFQLADIKERLSQVSAARIPFKINAVAMRNMNMTREGVVGLVDLAQSVGAGALKIIELLVMENHEELFDDFISLDSVREFIPKGFVFTRKNDRRDEYTSEDSNLKIELQKCRCRFGCRSCLSHITSCFSSDGSFWPCFEFSSSRFNIVEGSLDDAMDKGMKVLVSMAEKFGDQSPSLVKDIILKSSKREAYFFVDDPGQLATLLSQSEKIGKVSFTDIHLCPSDGRRASTVAYKKGRTFRSVKIRVHDGDRENSRLVISDIGISSMSGIYASRTMFLDPDRFPMTGSPEFILKTMSRLSWKTLRSISVSGDSYRHSISGLTFSCAKVNGALNTICFEIMDQSQLSALAKIIRGFHGLRPMKKPFFLSI